MSAWIVYSKDGKTKRCETRKLEYSGEFMGACSVSISVSSPSPIDFEIGDYLEYRGERFEMNYDPSVVKSSSKNTYGEGFVYDNVVFNSLSDELTRCDFLDYVSTDNQIHYSSLPTFNFFADSIDKLAERIKANLDRVYKDDKEWAVEVHSEYEGKGNVNISVSNMTVWDALSLVNSQFGATFIIRNRTITIGTAGIPMEKIFSYGKGKGLSQIERNAESNQKIITRLRAYGSTRNMPSGYYHNLEGGNVPNNMAVNNLMLPDFPEKTHDPYIDSENIEALGVREGTIFFDGSGDLEEIYPSMEGMTAEDLKKAGVSVSSEGSLDVVLNAEQISDNGKFEEGDTISSFTITLKDIGFDINDYLSTSAATISMKDGMCGGREFEIVSCEKQADGTYLLTCNRSEDTTLGLYFPYADYQIKTGDKFVLLNIEMPDVYVKAASQRLLEAAKAYLAKNDYVRYSYSPTVDNIFMARQHDEAKASGLKSIYETIKEGDLMMFEDDDMGVSGNIIIDTLNIKEDLENSIIPEYEITLKDEKVVGTIERLQNQIDSIVRNGVGSSDNTGKLNTEQITSIVKAVGDKTFLRKDKSDRTAYKVEFGQGIETGNFVSGTILEGGSGARIDEQGSAELHRLSVREFLEVPELRYNRMDVISGILWNSIAFGLVQSVDTAKCVCTLKLEEGEMSGLHTMDICIGIFSNFGNETVEEGFDDNGFPKMVGFSTSYFTPIEILKNKAGEFQFRYQLQEGTTVHPCQSMKFSVYGNFVEESRQACAYSTRTYKRYLNKVNTWKIDMDKNVYAQFGLLDGLKIGDVEMSGYGSYQHNCYLSGAFVRFTAQQKEELKGESAYSVELSDYEGIVILNEDGEILGGSTQLMNVVTDSEDGVKNVMSDDENVITSVYKLKTHVTAMRGSESLYYSLTTEKDAYTISIKPVGCEAMVLNGVIVITSVTDINDSHIEITVNCEGKVSFVKNYTITTVSDGESIIALTTSCQAVTKNSHGHYEPSSVLIRSMKGSREFTTFMKMYGKKSDTEYVALDMDSYTNPSTKWDVNLEAVRTADYLSIVFRSYKDGLDDKTYESEYVSEVIVNFVNDGATGAMARNRGEFSLEKEYAYNDEFRDYVWKTTNGTTDVYLRKTKYETSEGCEEGYIKGIDVTDTTYWQKAERSALTAIDTALIDTANIAGFMFRNGKMVSQETGSDPMNEQSNLILDGTNGEIIAQKGTFKGDLYGKTISFESLEKNSSGQYVLPTINGRYGMFYMDSVALASKSVVSKTFAASGDDTIVRIAGSSDTIVGSTITIENQSTIMLFSGKDTDGNDAWTAVVIPYWIYGKEASDSIKISNIEKVTSLPSNPDPNVLYIL